MGRSRLTMGSANFAHIFFFFFLLRGNYIKLNLYTDNLSLFRPNSVI